MDQAAVRHILIQYLNCVQLLLNDTMPYDLPEFLDDVIQQTKEFSDEMKSHQVRARQIRNSITEDIIPITPQRIDNADDSEGDEFKVVKTDKQVVASTSRLRIADTDDSVVDEVKVNQSVVRIRRLNDYDLKYYGVEVEKEKMKILRRRSIMENENYSNKNNVKPKSTIRQLGRLRADKDVEVRTEDRQNSNSRKYKLRNRRRCTVNIVNRYR